MSILVPVSLLVVALFLLLAFHAWCVRRHLAHAQEQQKTALLDKCAMRKALNNMTRIAYLSAIDLGQCQAELEIMTAERDDALAALKIVREQRSKAFDTLTRVRGERDNCLRKISRMSTNCKHARVELRELCSAPSKMSDIIDRLQIQFDQEIV